MKLSRLGCFVLIANAVLLAQPYVISTAAGGVGPATPVAGVNASISPVGMACDGAGNLYFSSGHAVYRLDAGNTLTRIAGNARPGFSGDGGAAIGAQLNNPIGLAVDGAANLYIADAGNGRIRRVTKDGVIQTIAGSDTAAYSSSDGKPATEARLYAPAGVAVDPAGNVYVSDNQGVRRISADGIIQTVATCPICGIGGNLAGVIFAP